MFVGVNWYGQLSECWMTIFFLFEISDPLTELTGNNCDEIYASLWCVDFVFERPPSIEGKQQSAAKKRADLLLGRLGR